MLTLTFTLNEGTKGAGPDLENADELELRYWYFNGLFTFRDTSADFSLEDVALFDIGLVLSFVLDRLRNGAKNESCEFTEGEGILEFIADPHSDKVSVHADYAPGTIQTSLRELSAATWVARHSLETELVTSFPALRLNRAFARVTILEDLHE